MGQAGVHLFLYDGECGLCSRTVRFLLTHDRRGVFRYTSLQGPTGRSVVARAGGVPHELTTLYVVANYGTPEERFMTKSRAALFAAGELGWPWKVARLLGALPERLLDRVYEFVARNRYRAFGRDAFCALPTEELKRRLVE